LRPPSAVFSALPCSFSWCRGSAARPAHQNDFTLKKFEIWNNDSRNRLVARLARAFIADDQDVLTRSLMRWPARERTGSPANVFVIVENLEHALRLLPKLQSWSILASGLVDLDGLSHAQRDAIANPRSVIDPLVSFGIITHGGMRRHEMPWARADVIIRADGGTDLPGLRVAALVTPTSSVRPLVLVDFDDTHHPELARRAVKRRRAYDNIGWFHPAIEPAGFRIAEFLKERTPRRGKGDRP
jgi:hypothetical protein